MFGETVEKIDSIGQVVKYEDLNKNDTYDGLTLFRK